jgi:hypothetical protein
MLEPQLQEKLRLLKIDVLSFLNTLAVSTSVALDLENISSSTSTSEPELKGIIGTLRRMKINDMSLILPAGRDSSGRLRWQLNQKLVNKKELAEFLEKEILGKAGLKIKR